MRPPPSPLLTTHFRPELWANPNRDPPGEKRELSRRRLRQAAEIQQMMAPDQLALVWRWDLINALGDLIWREAQVESLHRQLAEARQMLVDAEHELGRKIGSTKSRHSPDALAADPAQAPDTVAQSADPPPVL